MELLQQAEREPINGKHDGDTFSCANAQEFLDTMLMLREDGYRFPDYVLEQIRHEIEEQS